MKIKRWLLLVLCLSLFINSYAQLDTEERIEFELKEGYGGQYLAKFGEDGLLIHSKNTDAIGSNSKYKIERFSSGLKLEKTKYFDIPRKQFLDETYETDTHLYMFFKSRREAYTLLNRWEIFQRDLLFIKSGFWVTWHFLMLPLKAVRF